MIIPNPFLPRPSDELGEMTAEELFDYFAENAEHFLSHPLLAGKYSIRVGGHRIVADDPGKLWIKFRSAVPQPSNGKPRGFLRGRESRVACS